MLHATDLFAVLSPCGPLKCLINLASQREEAIPALLYEGVWPHRPPVLCTRLRHRAHSARPESDRNRIATGATFGQATATKALPSVRRSHTRHSEQTCDMRRHSVPRDPQSPTRRSGCPQCLLPPPPLRRDSPPPRSRRSRLLVHRSRRPLPGEATMSQLRPPQPRRRRRRCGPCRSQWPRPPAARANQTQMTRMTMSCKVAGAHAAVPLPRTAQLAMLACRPQR
jgi:hypothetical protein